MKPRTLSPGDKVKIKPNRFLPRQMSQEDRFKREGRVVDGSHTLGIYGIQFPSYKHTVDYARSELQKLSA